MYRLYQRQKSKRRRIVFWFCLVCLCALLVMGGTLWARTALRPKTNIDQSTAVTTQVSYNNPTKAYNEPGFSINLPKTWQLLPRTPGPYKSYTWQSPDRVTDGQEIAVFEDTIPTNLAVNRVLIVKGEADQLALNGTASDNCSSFTKNPTIPNTVAAPAEWNGVNFLCDQGNKERDVIGTSSTDGINTVILKNMTTGVNHKFFFMYTDEAINPDYTVFYNALESFRVD
jgi:hypothetical protein